MMDCHLCGGVDLTHLADFSQLPRVTSDCKAWSAGGTLHLCRTCGTLVKPPDAKWMAEISDIYSNYTIYHQADGQEQPVIVPETGELTSRSVCLLGKLKKSWALPERGRLLDVGCGNGSFLRSFHSYFPEWTTVGTEFDDKYKDLVESIGGVEGMHSQPLSDLEGSFDVISLIHVLEHIPFPGPVLQTLRQKLNPGGLLIVDLPDHQLNPLDLIVADHCTHFTGPSLQHYLARHGLRVELMTGEWIPKERVALACADQVGPLAPLDLETTERHARQAIGFLTSLLSKARSLRAQGRLGIFGTSIAGTWLHGALNGDFDFWVEEDPHRTGRPYLGKPVYTPRDAPAETILLAVSPTLAGLLQKNFVGLPGTYLLPA